MFNDDGETMKVRLAFQNISQRPDAHLWHRTNIRPAGADRATAGAPGHYATLKPAAAAAVGEYGVQGAQPVPPPDALKLAKIGKATTDRCARIAIAVVAILVAIFTPVLVWAAASACLDRLEPRPVPSPPPTTVWW